MNRSYYAVFHAIRAVNALDKYDSTKHTGVISHFRHYFIKTGELPKELSKIIDKTKDARENADYDDFYIVDKVQTKEQLNNAKHFIFVIEEYIINRVKQEEQNEVIENSDIPNTVVMAQNTFDKPTIDKVIEQEADKIIKQIDIDMKHKGETIE